MTADLEDLNELLQNVGARTNSELAWALERTVLLPLGDTSFAKELAAVVALHGFDRYFEADATNQRVLEFLMHLAIKDSLDVVASCCEGGIVLCRFGSLRLLGLLVAHRHQGISDSLIY